MKPQILNLIGWIGAGSLLTGFALVSFGAIAPDQLVYQLFNLVGAGGLLVVGPQHKTYQFVLINSVWLAVALVSIVRIFFV